MVEYKMNGNDLLEHTEKCQSCIEIQERLDNEVLSKEEITELENNMYYCFVNSLVYQMEND